jgi:hypothetical protein
MIQPRKFLKPVREHTNSATPYPAGGRSKNRLPGGSVGLGGNGAGTSGSYKVGQTYSVFVQCKAFVGTALFKGSRSYNHKVMRH